MIHTDGKPTIAMKQSERKICSFPRCIPGSGYTKPAHCGKCMEEGMLSPFWDEFFTEKEN